MITRRRSRRARTCADTAPARVLVTVMTCAADRRTHAVTDPEFRAGLLRGHGVYRAMCGRYILAASLGTPPGPICRHCADNSDNSRPGPEGRAVGE